MARLRQICQECRKIVSDGFNPSYMGNLLLVINIIATALICGKNAIKKKPCLSVLATFVVMLLFIAVVHMRMKVKLTTAEWQRDSLEQKLDSIKVVNGTNVSYYKYQPYKPKE